MTEPSKREPLPSNDQQQPEQEQSLEAVIAGIAGLSAADRAQLEAACARERRESERRAGAGEERLRLALEAGRMGTWEWDTTTGVQRWSPELVRLFGLAPGAGVYPVEAFYRLVHPDDLPGITAWAERAAAEGRDSVDDEFRVVRPDGELIWVASRARLYRDAAGRLTHVAGVNMDITARKGIEHALRQSKENLDLALAAAQMGRWDWDLVNNSYVWDATQYAIFGVRPQTFRISLEAIWAATHPDDRERLRALAAQALATGEPFRSEFRIVRPDGEVRWCVGGASVIRDHHRRPVWMSGITHDITERKRAEESLRQSEERLAKAFAASPDGLIISQVRDGAIREVNASFLRIFGLTREEAVGRSSIELELFDDPAERGRAMRLLSDQGYLHDYELVVRRRSGELRVALLSAELIELDGEPFLLSVMRDITERKRAEEALREVQARRLLEEQQHAARLQRLNAASLAINAALTRDEVLRLIVAEAQALIGATRAAVQLVAEGAWAFAPPAAASPAAPQSPFDEELRRLVYVGRRTLRLSQAELAAQLPRTDAPEVPAAGGGLLAMPLLNGDGASAGLIWLMGKADGPFTTADEALLQQLAQIAAIALEKLALIAQEQAARAQAEEASRIKDEFLGIVSHELRTPLTSFLGYAQLLQRRRHDEAFVERTIDQMLRSAKAQAQLIEDLLDVSRIVSGKLRIELRPVDLISVVEAALDTVRPALEAKRLRLRLALSPELGAVMGDASRLQQLVWNLLSNAAKFTPPGGMVEVRLAPQGRDAVLTVSDTGQGIAPAFLPHVFERFRQADSTSHRAHGGLGLGLAIVRHLVELHGGTARVASDGVDCGTTFTICLPLAATGAAGVPRSLVDALDEGCPPALAGLRVLLVDDQPLILDLLHDILAPCGVVIRTCASAREALEAVVAWRPDVLVSDIAMPGEDGYWLIQKVRALPAEEGGAVPAVALTAYVRIEDRMRVLAAGFQLYVPKPVEPDELRNVLARVARVVGGG